MGEKRKEIASERNANAIFCPLPKLAKHNIGIVGVIFPSFIIVQILHLECILTLRSSYRVRDLPVENTSRLSAANVSFHNALNVFSAV
jgi:hypothetical protein